MTRAFIAWLVALGASVAAADTSLRDELSAKLAASTCLAATFEQQLLSAEGELLQHSRGMVHAAKPHKLRWAIHAPDTQLIVSDGKTLWRYEEDLEQLIIAPFDQHGAGLPARLLAGDPDALVAYDISFAGDGYELRPTAPADLFEALTLRFSGSALVGVAMLDSFEQITDIRLTAAPDNCNDDQLYHFVAPEGIDVIYE